MWMNEGEIDEAYARYKSHDELGPVVRLLRDYRDEVNRKSDGWPHWSAGSGAAEPLMEILRGKRPLTTFADAQASLKRFCTRRNLNYPTIDNLVATQRRKVASLEAQLAVEVRHLANLEREAGPQALSLF